MPIDLTKTPTVRSVGTQSYTYVPYGNFTYRTLEYIPGYGLIWASHNNGSGQFSKLTLAETTFSVANQWASNYGYVQGIAYYDGKVWFTDYSSNNASLKYFTPGAAGSTPGATTQVSSGYGYGGVPLVNVTTANGSSLYRPSPVSTSYSWSSFNGIDRVLGSTANPSNITFAGVSGFQDITFDGENFYVLSPTGTSHEKSLSGAEHVDVKVFNLSGQVVATYTDVVTVPSGQTAQGIAYDPEARLLYVLVGLTNNSSPAKTLYSWSANTAPEVSITQPTASQQVDPRGTVDVSWNYSDLEGNAQSQWEVGYKQGGTSIWYTIGSGAGAQTTYTIPANTLPDESDVTLSVRVHDGEVWSDTATVDIRSDSWTYGAEVAGTDSSAQILGITDGVVYEIQVATADTEGLGPYSVSAEAFQSANYIYTNGAWKSVVRKFYSGGAWVDALN